jgi:D-glycero-alpha-D-manno-heptose 1-phosphate guanylyltransferase
MIDTAIVLVGGKGTRLASVVSEVPKPMAPIAGHPFLDYLIDYLKFEGICHLVLSVGYKADVIKNHYGSGEKFGLQIDYVDELEPLGTGGAAKLAAANLGLDEFWLVNGDTLAEVSLKAAEAAFKADSTARALVVVRSVDNVDRFGSIELSSNRVVSMREKGKVGAGLVNAGIYILTADILSEMDANVFSLEEVTLPKLVQSNSLIAYTTEGYFMDIGIPESYELAQTQIPEWMSNKISDGAN